MKRHFLLLIFTLFCCAQVFANGDVSGKIVDANSGNPLEMVAVQVFALKNNDTVFVTGVQTDLYGNFLLPKTVNGKYILRFSALGYKTQDKIITVADQNVAVGAVRLQENVQELSAVQITGKAAEMTVKGDTLEYNTAAYSLNENAMVEDLLKKMAGVEVDKDGNVTVNGESISSVQIDGKKFFGSDVQMATKNIPAEMIDKIQVVDNKSDMAKLTGIEDDNTERIINLKLKENRKKGLFGNHVGGLGADWITDNGEWFDYNNSEFGANSSEKTRHFFKNDFRYNANLFTNLLTGESQTTIVGNANNTNEIRSGRGRGFWGGSNSGITRTENIGVNTNIDASKKVDGLLIGSDAQFTHSHNNTQTKQDKTTYGDDVVYDNTDSISKITKSWDAKVRLEFEWTIDTLNTVFFKPTISYTNNESNGYNEYIYYRDTTEIINDGNQSTYSLSEDISAELNVIYNRKLQKKGRVLTLNGSFSFTNTKGNSSTLSYDNLLKKTLIDQYTHSGNDALSYSLKVSYMEPLSKDCRHLMEINATYRANHRDSHKDQFSKNELSGDYEYDSTYSNALKNNFYSEIAELNYRFLSEHSDLTVGASINPSQTRSTSYYGSILARDTLLSVVNWSPNVSFRYKFGKKEFARVIYRGNSTQPTITQLEPVRNNSNAMSETVGNLGLQPAFTHRFRFFYSRYNEKRFSNLMTGIRANLTQDALVNNTIYDQRGKVYSQTVNAKTIPWNIGMHLMYNTPFAKKLFQFHTRTSANYRSQVGYVLREQQTAVIEQMIEKNQLVLGNKSFTNNLTANENIMLRFTHDIVDIGVRGDFTYSYTTNTFSSTKSNVYSWSATGDLQFHLPKSWNINADCGYSDKIGYGNDLGNMSEIMLNASIEKSWGAATLSIKAFDILNQRKNVVQVVGADYIKYEKYNTLPTYGMITFSYKINRMGSLKATGRAAFMQEMIDNKGGMPSGPPPMHR